MADDIVYGIEPETGLVHAFAPSVSGWTSWCCHYTVMLWTRWKKAPVDATPTCLYCAIRGCGGRI